MIRKLFLPALLVGLLGGCVTDYGYRDGYYYGQPSVEYRYHDYGYPYGYYPSYQYGYYPYRQPYRQYNYYNYNNPYYRHGYPYYYNRDHRRPPVTGTQPMPGTDGDTPRLPIWRNPAQQRPRGEAPYGDARAQTFPPVQQQQPEVREAPRRAAGGLRMDEVLQRGQGGRRKPGQREP